MRNITWALLAFLLLFTACNSDDEYAVNEPSGSALVKNNHFYGVKTPDVPTTRGVAQRSKLWHPSANIKVKFLNGTSTFQNKVKTYAKEWEQHMSVRFEFVTSGNADVRVGFDWNDERYITWSYTGTDCKFVTNQNEATMSFAYFDSMSDMEIRADVLRAFGQALGLELEHRHLNFNEGWTSRISTYWEGEVEDIPWETLKQYVFDPLNSGDVLQTETYDANSIMIWPFSARYASNTARERNYDLSAKDIEFIGSLYPVVDAGVAVVMRTTKEITDFILTIGSFESSAITIDWGDGTRENVSSDYYDEDGIYWYSFFHLYKAGIDHTIKVYADAKSIISFSEDSQGYGTAQIDISKCINLEDFDKPCNSIPFFDFSKNTKLKVINLHGYISGINLSKNTLLECLYISSDYLFNLDISKNTLLKELSISGNKFSTIDLSKNVALESLFCTSSEINTLNVNKNTQLRYVEISNTPLERNATELISFVNSLPYAYGNYGRFFLIQNTNVIASILQSKNWKCNQW